MRSPRCSSQADSGSWALLAIDVVNDLDFPDGESLRPYALQMAVSLAALKRRCRELSIPAIYVNDNFGRWRSDFHGQVQHCLRFGSLGREIVELLLPEQDDYFVLKPQHSGFYGTTLDVLLDHLGAGCLILAGLATDRCVLLTAADAYMRGYRLAIPADCVAARAPAEGEQALTLAGRVLKADTRPWSDLVAALT